MEVFCYFKVTSEDMALDELIRTLGSSATETWKKGDCKPNTKMVAKHNGWQIKHRCIDDRDPVAVLNSFLDSVMHYELAVNSLSRSNVDIMVSLIIYDQDVQGCYFERGVLEKISRLNADLNIDPYLIS